MADKDLVRILHAVMTREAVALRGTASDRQAARERIRAAIRDALAGPPGRTFDDLEASHLAAATPAAWPCDHRGEAVDSGLCAGCERARKMIPIYACAVHGRAVLYPLADRSATLCKTCRDRHANAG